MIYLAIIQGGPSNLAYLLTSKPDDILVGSTDKADLLTLFDSKSMEHNTTHVFAASITRILQVPGSEDGSLDTLNKWLLTVAHLGPEGGLMQGGFRSFWGTVRGVPLREDIGAKLFAESETAPIRLMFEDGLHE